LNIHQQHSGILKEELMLDFDFSESKTVVATTTTTTSTTTKKEMENEELENQKKIEIKKEYTSRIKSNLSFTEALELDLFRLKSKMTTDERDDILVQQGFKLSNFDPNQFIYKRDDKIEGIIRKKSKTNTCHQCSTSIKLIYVSCRYCSFSFCKSCMAKEKTSILEFKWNTPQVVCQSCFSLIQKQNECMKEIRKYLQMEESED
jgi:hypothetical protein